MENWRIENGEQGIGELRIENGERRMENREWGIREWGIGELEN